jgi:AcrR family transcriptional regulator
MSGLSDSPAIWFRSGRQQRGPRPALTRDQITRAAVELGDAEGIEAVSMRRLAARLGSAATSLYSYVETKADLYELVVDEVIGEIRVPEPSGDWRADLRRIAVETHDVLSRHRWTIMLGIQPGLGPKTRRYGEQASACLAGLGLEPAAILNVLATLNNYVFGFIHREAAWEHLAARTRLGEQEWLGRIRAAVEEARNVDPELETLVEARLALRGRESFDFGLDCLLDGFAIRIQRDGVRPAPAARKFGG